MSFDLYPVSNLNSGLFPRRSLTLTTDDSHVQTVTIFLHEFNPESCADHMKIDLHKRTTTEELIEKVLTQRSDLMGNIPEDFDLYEVMGTVDGQTFKERKLDKGEYPVALQMLWSRQVENDGAVPKNRFVLRHKGSSSLAGGIHLGSSDASSTIDSFLAKFLTQPQDREYADLCMLPELTEQTLLDNLRDRFNSGHIYTYIGPILVAVNPFQFYPIYNPKYARLYCQSRRLGSLPPHIFAIADITYHNMLRIKENQCIVISGESGSGKTESTNFLLHHLTTLSQKGSTGSSVEQILLSAGPVLEAFGNAMTVQNNNSSRFGKFIRVNYRENGMVLGASVEIYLLEKSRIISQAKDERNYHVFYYLLKGASEEERQHHFLLQATDYNYLNQSNYRTAECVNEKSEYERLKLAMDSVGFSRISQKNMFSVLSAVLLLGNTEYVKRPGYHSDENAYIENGELIGIISELLQIKASNLQQALTMRRTVLKSEVVITRYSVNEAVNTRDAMAKCLYNALFHWIVLRINHALLKRESLSSKKGFFIGILDIFGFEDVGAKWNSFEQLCINYANEHLQAYFNQHIFQFEQEEYCKEGISWTNIEYIDNTECVQLFQNKPCGILRLIDEESNINNGTDLSMLDKLNHFLKNNEYYETPQKKEPAFIIAHYAGKVKYQIKGFREKNMDLMRQDVLMVLKNSKSAFVRELVGDDPVAIFHWSTIRATFRAINAFRQSTRGAKRTSEDTHSNICDIEKPISKKISDSHLNAFLRGEISPEIVPDFCDKSVFKAVKLRALKQPAKMREERYNTLKILQSIKALSEKKRITGKPSSVSKQFQYSLSSLMKTLAKATPYFIRCIKSNNEKIANKFDDNIILRQLRYTGMLETVRIRRAGYSFRIEYNDFIKQYRVLLSNDLRSTKEDVKEFFLQHPLIESDRIQFGITKIFMRDSEKLLIDDQLHRIIMQHIETLQHWFRAFLARAKYLKLRKAIIVLQALARGMLVRNRLQERINAAIIIQSNWKRFLAERRYRQIRNTIITIQSMHKGNQMKIRYENMKKASKKTNVPKFGITNIVKKKSLAMFDLNDPESLAIFAVSDDEDEDASVISNSSSFLYENEDEGHDSTISDTSEAHSTETNINLNATFIVEDKKLKLVNDKIEADFKRRQSLATTSSSTKLRMLRRAASTENDRIVSKDEASAEPQSPETKHKSRRMGFTKAKKQLKAFLIRRNDLGTSDDDERNESHMNVAAEESNGASRIRKTHSIKMARLHRSEHCALCNKNLTGILGLNHKCTNCKLSFHKECVNFASSIPCQMIDLSSNRHDITPPKKPLHPSKMQYGLAPLSIQSPKKFNLFKTKQQTDPMDLVIESVEDLKQFSAYIAYKLKSIEKNINRRDTAVDAIFKEAVKEFRLELISNEPHLQESKTVLKYRDLIANFEGSLTKVSNNEQVRFPTTLGVNAFRGFVNSYVQERKLKCAPKKASVLQNVRKKRRKSDATLHYKGHRFKLDLIHLPTCCEVCEGFMWNTDKMYTCARCNATCHKKCHSKISKVCRTSPSPSSGKRFFGANLNTLVNDDRKIPVVIDKLFATIEVHALYVEGIYRKSAAIAQVRNARNSIENSSSFEDLCFNDMPVHVMATLVKCFFRELPEPLITFDLYENFLNASEVEEKHERIRCLSVIVELLPRCNKAVLDRLVYHLARIAQQESVNKMNSSNLALIFAPCILRNNQIVHAQEQLRDINRQAICVQSLIDGKLKQFRSAINELVSLEHVSDKITKNLQLLDEHKNLENITGKHMQNIDTARQLFIEQLDFLDNEKEKLIQDFPPLAPVASSEDLSSSDEHSNNNFAFKGHRQEEYALDLETPPIFCTLKNLSSTRPRNLKKRSPSNQFRRSIKNDLCSFDIIIL